MVSSKPPLILLVGPTAVGKTATAIRLAQELGGEIVSADSRLFYRGMDIGTAKPTVEERAQVPHHLIDIVNPDQTMSLAVFQQMARAAIADIQRGGKVALLVGGDRAIRARRDAGLAATRGPARSQAAGCTGRHAERAWE